MFREPADPMLRLLEEEASRRATVDEAVFAQQAQGATVPPRITRIRNFVQPTIETYRPRRSVGQRRERWMIRGVVIVVVIAAVASVVIFRVRIDELSTDQKMDERGYGWYTGVDVAVRRGMGLGI